MDCVDFRTFLRRTEEKTASLVGYQHFLPIPAGEGRYRLSIQASEYHYSQPRKLLDSPWGYESFEVAILHNEDGWGLLQPRDFTPIPAWADIFEEGSSPIASYVSVETVQRMLEDLADA